MRRGVGVRKKELFCDWSVRKKIFWGYLSIITVMLSVTVILLAVLWEQFHKENIQQSLRSSNYSVKKTIDNYFDNVIKLSEYPYFNTDIIQFLEKDYSKMMEDRKTPEQIRDISDINSKIYKHIYYMHNQVDAV